jgi:lipopolysaccharide transport system ATP-binding protein
MRVRLGFAVAAHLEPEILIIDEVLAVGDINFQRKCLGKMGEVGASGRTVLFVSHNLALVEHICNRAMYIDGGVLVMDDNVADVIKAYNTSAIEKSEYSDAYYVDRELLNDETGNKNISLTDIELLTSQYSRAVQIQTTDQVVIRLYFNAHERLMSPAFVVSFKTSSGLELFRMSTRPISGFDTGYVQGSGYIDLKIDSLSLTSGEYLVDVRIARENTEWIRRYENVVKIYISPKDVYQSGTALDNSRGYFVLPHEWSIKQEQPPRDV